MQLSKIMDIVNRQNSSNENSEEQHSLVGYNTTADDRTTEEALSLVDVYNQVSGNEESCTCEDFSQNFSGKKEHKHISRITKQDKGTSHVPHKSPVPLNITTETQKKSAKGEGQNRRQKKNGSKHRIKICATNCKYDVVREIAMKLGMEVVDEDNSWNLYWSDLTLSIERAREMKRFQKTNHFLGMVEICRKDLLARNLNRMLKTFPNDYNFFPKTWCLPSDYGELVAYARTVRNQTYICKPETGSQGKGIYVTKTIKHIQPHDRLICQVYISKPFLVDGFKFDMRIYVLITSCDPLRIYAYNDGLARFATIKYREPTHANASNVFMHLTNYAVNKHSDTYVVDDETGSKRKISTLTDWLLKKNYNVHEMWSNIDDVIVKTVIAAHPILKHNYHACFPAHDFTYACFELLGFDILLDYRLKPYILEVNHSPSFHIDSQVDRDIKESLIQDTFIILNLTQADRRKVIEEDRQRMRDKLLQGLNHRKSEHGNNVNSGTSHQDHWKIQVTWEESHLGNFRCIYPSCGFERYEQFLHKNLSSLFKKTAASRAREECARMKRQELEERAKAAAGKPVWKNKNFDKLRPESPSSRENKSGTAVKKRHVLPTKKPVAEEKQPFLNSFQQDTIIESEESDVNIAMAQRDFLIKKFEIGEQIQEMLKNGSLRLDDEKKLYFYERVHDTSHPEDESSNLPAKVPHSVNPHLPLRINKKSFSVNPNHQPVNTDATVASTASKERLQSRSCSTSNQHQPLAGSSSSYNSFMHPTFPQAVHISEGINKEINKEIDVRFTRTHMARYIANRYKLQALEKREQQCHYQNESES